MSRCYHDWIYDNHAEAPQSLRGAQRGLKPRCMPMYRCCKTCGLSQYRRYDYDTARDIYRQRWVRGHC